MAQVWAQQPARLKIVGLLVGSAVESRGSGYSVSGFRLGLAESKWLDGKNMALDVRLAKGDPALMKSHAAALAQTRCDVYAVQSATALRALLGVVSREPVVFYGVSDPVGNGFVPQLARPGGHVTGFSLFPYEVGPRWLQLLQEAVPSLQTVTVLMGAQNPNLPGWRRQIEPAAQRFRLATQWPVLRETADIEQALRATVATRNSAGVLVLPDPFMGKPEHGRALWAFAKALPMIGGVPGNTRSGALLSYEVDQVDLSKRAGHYVGRILAGEKPGDLPVQQPTRYELSVNRTAAAELGIKLPASIMAQADEIID